MVRKIKFVTAIFLIIYISCTETKRARPNYVDKNAEWVGGIDGGVWIKYNGKSKKPNEFEFTIYLESGSFLETGTPSITSIFLSNCTFKPQEGLKSQIIAFDGENLILAKKLTNGKQCVLAKAQKR